MAPKIEHNTPEDATREAHETITSHDMNTIFLMLHFKILIDVFNWPRVLKGLTKLKTLKVLLDLLTEVF